VDLAKKAVLREVVISDAPQLWRWVSETLLAVVCKRAVYHIDINAKSSSDPATLVFSK
jgi:hypothetical protein